EPVTSKTMSGTPSESLRRSTRSANDAVSKRTTNPVASRSGERPDIERDVGSRSGMCERADADDVDACSSELGDPFELHAAGDFDERLATRASDAFDHVGVREVVEHDDVGTGAQCFVELGRRSAVPS